MAIRALSFAMMTSAVLAGKKEPGAKAATEEFLARRDAALASAEGETSDDVSSIETVLPGQGSSQPGASPSDDAMIQEPGPPPPLGAQPMPWAAAGTAAPVPPAPLGPPPAELVGAPHQHAAAQGTAGQTMQPPPPAGPPPNWQATLSQQAGLLMSQRAVLTGPAATKPPPVQDATPPGAGAAAAAPPPKSPPACRHPRCAIRYFGNQHGSGSRCSHCGERRGSLARPALEVPGKAEDSKRPRRPPAQPQQQHSRQWT